ncbi:MAG: hypothetical protein O3A93_12970 [Chloroflexi bacterium]|nr:hypothetical protein [Chloroflexota bacterium]MDA1272147.1 hypothetical protein [Chloroflexota bacterium]PKB58512.1 MAG: hypothetical protein BZY83_06710 [SAR202 cluster bacterium Casp-Chloro-G2]
MTKTRFLALITALALLLTIPTAVFAQRVPPHIFTGTAVLDGATAVDGTAVTAWVDGAQVAATNISASTYTIKVDEVDGSFSGKTVSFRVGSANADQTATWIQGGADILDLTASSGNTGSGSVPGGTGDVGPAGPKGDKGDTGAAGPAGPKGDSGSDGTDGSNGAPGAMGPAGPAGDDGGSLLSIIALIVAIVALLGAGGAYMMGRRA